MKKTIVVTGAGGQLGSELFELHSSLKDYEFKFLRKTDLNITDKKAIDDYFDEVKPFACINAAAYTAVDKAEAETEAAKAVNTDAAGWLALAAEKNGSLFIHVSTDYVFSGDKNTPYSETDAAAPQGAYGRSKYEGELEVQKNHSAPIIIRTSWLYSSYGSNLVKTVLRLSKERELLEFVIDQVGSPTYAADLADAILQIVQDEQVLQKSGIYHYANSGAISWFDFVHAIIELEKSNCRVEPILSGEYPVPAKRPHYSVLNTEKIRSTFDIKIPYWRHSLSRCLENLRNE